MEYLDTCEGYKLCYYIRRDLAALQLQDAFFYDREMLVWLQRQIRPQFDEEIEGEDKKEMEAMWLQSLERQGRETLEWWHPWDYGFINHLKGLWNNTSKDLRVFNELEKLQEKLKEKDEKEKLKEKLNKHRMKLVCPSNSVVLQLQPPLSFVS